jgi:hypothetical protein
VEYRWNTRTGSSELRHRDGGSEVDPFGAGRDRGEYHVGGWHREVLGVMLADPEEVHPGRRVVARDAGRPPARVTRRPRPVLELVVADVVKALDHARAGQPPG